MYLYLCLQLPWRIVFVSPTLRCASKRFQNYWSHWQQDTDQPHSSRCMTPSVQYGYSSVSLQANSWERWGTAFSDDFDLNVLIYVYELLQWDLMLYIHLQDMFVWCELINAPDVAIYICITLGIRSTDPSQFTISYWPSYTVLVGLMRN